MSERGLLEQPGVREFLARTVRGWLGLPAASHAAVPELPERLARLLLRVEEYERSHRDRWDCWEFGFSENFRDGTLWTPEIDHWVARRREELAGEHLAPPWPSDRAFAVCITHDVDLVSGASTPRQALRSIRASLATPPGASRSERAVRFLRPAVRAARAARGGVSRAPATRALELTVDLEHERGITASYLFTVHPGAAASRFDCNYEPYDPCRFRGERRRIRDVLRLLAQEGFDIGLHGSYNSATQPKLLTRERAALEQASGLEVTTTRQHFLHWDVRATPRLQEQAGLKTDSTLGFNRNVGFRAGTSLPYRHFDLEHGRPLDLLEVPLVLHDGPLLREDGLGLDTELARQTIGRLLDAVADVGGVATLLVHPNNLERADYLELFRWSIDYGLERKAWFASLRDIDAWWRGRELRLLA